jgi:hypothetical protein
MPGFYVLQLSILPLLNNSVVAHQFAERRGADLDLRAR